jgi:lysine-specific demethylase 3
MAPLRLNGHHHGSPASAGKEDDEEDDEEDLSSGEEEDAKPTPKPQRKKSSAKAKPGPKPKGRPAGTGKAKGNIGGTATKRAVTKGSESDNYSDSEKESDSSKNSSRQSEVGSSGGAGASKKRGRKPLKAGGGKPKVDEAGEPRPKKLKSEAAATSTVGTLKSGDPFARPSISQLKKTGDSFLQDASCFEVAPKLNKCRECRWSQAQRQKQSLANIFCRFYAFRRLRYTKNGQIAQAGFCDPRQDAQAEDLKLWLPSQELSPPDMDKETAKLILRHLSSQFYTIYR